MRIEQLEQLIQIKQWGSMNVAAQYLHMTHQNLNRSMKQLEDELGITLFLRNTKGTVFTNDGEKILAFAIRTINDYNKLLTSFRSTQSSSIYDNETHMYKLNVALANSMDNLFNSVLYNIVQQNFSVAPNVYELSLDSCMNTVENSSIHDIVVLQQDYKYLINHSKAANNYHLFALYIEKLDLIINKSSSYAQLKSISRSLFETIPLVILSQNTKPSAVAQICLDNKIKLNIISYTNIVSTMQELLLAGGLGVIGVPSVQKVLYSNPIIRDSIISIPIDIPLRIATAFFIKKELCETPLGEAILSILNDAYGKTLEQLY